MEIVIILCIINNKLINIFIVFFSSWGNEETHTNQEVGLSLNNNNTSNKSSNPSLISIINEPQFSSTSWAGMLIFKLLVVY